LQLAGISRADLLAGRFPAGGDDSWSENLYSAIVAWGDKPRTVLGIVHPGAPPWTGPVACNLERPPLAPAASPL
jgi:hypothetical protein